MDIIERLNSFLTYTGLSTTQFADEAGIPRPSLSQILNGRNKKISNELLAKLHDAFPALNILWLVFGEGDMINRGAAAEDLASPSSSSSSSSPSSSASPATSVPPTPPIDSELASQIPPGVQWNVARSEPEAYYGGRPVSSINLKESIQEKNTEEENQIGKEPKTTGDKADKDEMTEEKEAADMYRFANANSAVQQQNTETLTRRITTIMVFYDDNSYEVFRQGAL